MRTPTIPIHVMTWRVPGTVPEVLHHGIKLGDGRRVRVDTSKGEDAYAVLIHAGLGITGGAS